MPEPTPVEWEYTRYQLHREILEAALGRVFFSFYTEEFAVSKFLGDTRGVHRAFFISLTPLGFEYFACNYRGSTFPALQFYTVTFGSRVGYPPAEVKKTMERFHEQIKPLMSQGFGHLPGNFSPITGEQLEEVIDIACRIFMVFTSIHPYANGNGHIGRLVILAVLEYFGLEVTRGFTVEPRPGPPYLYCIEEYENGNPFPLQEYIADCIGTY